MVILQKFTPFFHFKKALFFKLLQKNWGLFSSLWGFPNLSLVGECILTMAY
jgi:hypothetical protein